MITKEPLTEMEEDLMEMGNIEIVSYFMFLISKFEHEKDKEEIKMLRAEIKLARKEIQKRMIEQ